MTLGAKVLSSSSPLGANSLGPFGAFEGPATACPQKWPILRPEVEPHEEASGHRQWARAGCSQEMGIRREDKPTSATRT